MFYLFTIVDTVATTIDTTKNAAASAVDKGAALVGSAKDTVATTFQSTVDTTKNVAASAVEKGSSLVGSAKGIIVIDMVHDFSFKYN